MEERMIKKSFETKNMIVHLGYRNNQQNNTDFEYEILLHGHNHVYPPVSKQELKNLINFISNFIEEYSND